VMNFSNNTEAIYLLKRGKSSMFMLSKSKS